MQLRVVLFVLWGTLGALSMYQTPAHASETICRTVCQPKYKCYRQRKCYSKPYCYPVQRCRWRTVCDDEGEYDGCYKKRYCWTKRKCTYRRVCKYYKRCGMRRVCRRVCRNIDPEADDTPGTPPPTTPPPTYRRPPIPPPTYRPRHKRPSYKRGQCGMSRREQRVLTLINKERRRRGAPALRCHYKLVAASRAWSRIQCAQGSLSHKYLSKRFRAAGVPYTSIGENVAAGQSTAYAVVRSWMKSPGHRRNILNPSYTHVGIGATSCSKGFSPYWTQMFLRIRSSQRLKTTPIGSYKNEGGKEVY